MRTTLTLDDDVASDLARTARATGRPIRAVVNEALRSGLRHAVTAAAPFSVEPFDSGGVREGLSLDSISGLLGRVEGRQHR